MNLVLARTPLLLDIQIAAVLRLCHKEKCVRLLRPSEWTSFGLWAWVGRDVTWSLHSFGLCGVWGALWLWLLGAPWGTIGCCILNSTAPAAWTLGHIFLTLDYAFSDTMIVCDVLYILLLLHGLLVIYFSLWTMHFLIPWLFVLFVTYTVLCFVFVAFMFWFVSALSSGKVLYKLNIIIILSSFYLLFK